MVGMKPTDVKVEDPQDVAQAGIIRVPLDAESAPHLVQSAPSWAPYDPDVLEQLPYVLPPTTRSRKKQPTVVQPFRPLLRALADLNERWGRFTYIINDSTLYIRVHIFLRRHHLDEEIWKSAGKVMFRTCRAWDLDDIASWNPGDAEPLIMIDKDPRTLSEIYTNLPSPRVTRGDRNRLDAGTRQIINELETELGPVGLRDDTTTRYRYQVNSVMKMLLQERAPSRMMDPAWSQLQENGHGGTIRKYWINTVDWQARRTDESIATAELQRGGLLCEEMGVGKTLISLMLILATKSHFPNPPADVKHSQVVTDYALETFPFQPWQDLRTQYRVSYRDVHSSSKQPRMGPPPLSKLAEVLFLRKPRYTRQGSRAFFGTRKEEKLRNIKPFYFVEDTDPTATQHQYDTRRRIAVQWNRGAVQSQYTYKKRYITGCTLIVAPSLLIAQWKSQISSHLEAGSLTYAVVENAKDSVVPSIKTLVNLDILLFAKEAFVRESPTNSRLLDLHFKRVMFDEGHFGAGGMVSKTLVLAKLLVSESRWVITGTPATHLIGDRKGLPNQDAPEQLPQMFEGVVKRADSEDGIKEEDTGDVHGHGAQNEGTDVYMRDELEEEEDVKPDISALTQVQVDDEGSDSDYQGPVSANAWSKDAIQDLGQIGKLFTDFLYTPILQSFGKTIKQAASDKRGPQVNVVAKLDALLRKALVRNNLRDVEQEQRIPAMTNYQTGFELSHIGKLTFNFMQAVVARHVITPAGTTSVAQKASKASVFSDILQNLKECVTWYAGGASMHPLGILKTLAATEAQIRERISSGKSDAASREQDLAILVEAQQHVKAAYEDPLWHDIMLSTSLPLETFGWTVPSHVADAWNQCEGGLHSVQDQGDEGVRMVAQHFVTMRDRMIRDRMETPQEHFIILVEQANEWRRKEEENRKKLEEARAEARKPKSQQEKKPKKPAKPKTKGEDLKKTSAAAAREHKRLSELANGLSDNVAEVEVLDDRRVEALRSLPLVFTTDSSKISWVVHEIQRCPADTFVIFSHSLNSLAYLREALDIAHIQVCHVSTDGKMPIRMANLSLFQAGVRQVCLMELKLAARGLNLVVANRLIFLEPVWQKDVEAQALKRIHRIGQKRPTASHTLFLENTYEQIKIKRRDETSTEVEEINDWQMQDLIRHPRFYNAPPIQPTIITTSLTGGPIDQDLVPQALAAAEAIRTAGSTIIGEDVGPAEPALNKDDGIEKEVVAKPRKRVRIVVDSDYDEPNSETSSGTSRMSIKRVRVIE